MTWDEWRGDLDGRAVMWIKTVAARLGCRIDLHKFVDHDSPGCFHTHPAHAVRIVLWGGYVEELEDGTLHCWRPGDMGLVPPRMSHRVLGLLDAKPAYTLWLRGRKTHVVELRGDGWPPGINRIVG